MRCYKFCLIIIDTLKSLVILRVPHCRPAGPPSHTRFCMTKGLFLIGYRGLSESNNNNKHAVQNNVHVVKKSYMCSLGDFLRFIGMRHVAKKVWNFRSLLRNVCVLGLKNVINTRGIAL